MLLSVRLRFSPYLKNLNSKLYFKPQQWGTLCIYHRKRITSPMVFLFFIFFKRWWYHVFDTCFSYILLHVRPPNIHQLTNDPSRVKVWLHFCCLKCRPWMFFSPTKVKPLKVCVLQLFWKKKTPKRFDVPEFFLPCLPWTFEKVHILKTQN